MKEKGDLFDKICLSSYKFNSNRVRFPYVFFYRSASAAKPGCAQTLGAGFARPHVRGLGHDFPHPQNPDGQLGRTRHHALALRRRGCVFTLFGGRHHAG